VSLRSGSGVLRIRSSSSSLHSSNSSRLDAVVINWGGGLWMSNWQRNLSLASGSLEIRDSSGMHAAVSIWCRDLSLRRWPSFSRMLSNCGCDVSVVDCIGRGHVVGV
jgi:hypothetical protein